MHGLSFSSLLIPFLWTNLQMAPTVELPVDGLSYRGCAQMLYNILEDLCVPTKQVVMEGCQIILLIDDQELKYLFRLYMLLWMNSYG